MNKILVTFLVLANILFAFSFEQEFNIKTVKVQKKNISNYKEFYAKVKADKTKVYDLNLRFSGYITKLYANKDFMYINKGDKLFDIYSKEVYNLYDELAIAQNSSKRIYNSLKNKIELFDINIKDKNKDKTTLIRSKFSGYITKHNINKGSFVKAGELVFQINDLSSVWVILNIYQKDISFVKKDMNIDIKIDGIDKIYKSKIDKIYPNINSKDQSIPVRVVLDNTDLKLFPNMFAKAKIYENEKNILVVPKNAVIKRDSKQYVFFKDGKEYSPSEVVAKRIPSGYEIIEGLEEGDKIVSNALFLLDSDAITNGLYSDDW